MVRAKLLVPSGTPDQDSCGDTLSPTQFGLLPAFLLATFFGISVPSLKVVEVSANGSAALPTLPMHHEAEHHRAGREQRFHMTLGKHGSSPESFACPLSCACRFVPTKRRKNIPILSQSILNQSRAFSGPEGKVMTPLKDAGNS